MPEKDNSPLIAAGINAAGNAATAGINYASTNSTNKAAQKFAQQQSDRQRSWAKEDWNAQNEYNTPAAQMARLKAAGLNPNLVYGNGADATAQPIRSSEPAHWNPQAPSFDAASIVSGGLGAYYDTQLKTAQIDQLKQQTALAAIQGAQVAAQTQNTQASTTYTNKQTENLGFDLGMKSKLAETTVAAAQAGLNKVLAETEKTKTDTSYTISQNERAQLTTAQSISEGIERILKSRSDRATNQVTRDYLRAQLSNLKKDGKLKQLDINLKQNGVQPSDNIGTRIISQYLSEHGGPKQLEDDFKESMKNFFHFPNAEERKKNRGW